MRPDSDAGPSLRLLATVVLTVFCAVLAGVAVSWVRGTLTPVWLGTAVMVYWLLRTPRRDWPSIVTVCWLANVAASIVMGRSIPRAILLPTVNLLEAVLVALPLRIYRLDGDFARPLTLAAFYGLVLGPATVIAATIGAFVTQRMTSAPFLQIWMEWYTTTALGQAVLVPPLMVLRKDSLAAIFRRDLLPGTLILLGIVVATIALNAALPQYPLGFLFFPAVVLITFQRGFGGGAVGLALVLLYLAGGLRDIHNALSVSDARLHLLFVQLYIAAISFTVIVV
ncbi:MAG TPA: MASE1 domain-containing protein, partial [Rhizomicrobium sp.]|nr:MASE1 domain-containing protein [Rhizomicrobium sp.]